MGSFVADPRMSQCFLRNLAYPTCCRTHVGGVATPRSDFQGPKTLRHYVFRCTSDAQPRGGKLRVGRGEAARRLRGGCKDRMFQIAAPPSW